MNQTTNQSSVQLRFFEAIDALRERGVIGGLQTFTARYGLNRTKYSRVRTAIRSGAPGQYQNIDIDALSYIVTDYGISARWLLTGNGNMFVVRTK